MYAKTVFVTQDGKRHDTQEKASQHADTVYHEFLRAISNDIVSATVKSPGKLPIHNLEEWIDQNLFLFRRLQTLKDDRVLITDKADTE